MYILKKNNNSRPVIKFSVHISSLWRSSTSRCRHSVNGVSSIGGGATPGAVAPLGSSTYRELFVWDRSFCHDIFTCNERDLKHPTSGHHVLAAYATEYHRHRSYNFNNSMDFELFMSAIQPHVTDSSPRIISTCDTQADGLHDVLIWPDRLWVRCLRLIDVAEVLKLSMCPSTIDPIKVTIGNSAIERLKGIHILSCNGGHASNTSAAGTSLSLCLNEVQSSTNAMIQDLRGEGVHGWRVSSMRGFYPNRLLLLPLEFSDLHVATPTAARELIEDATAASYALRK